MLVYNLAKHGLTSFLKVLLGEPLAVRVSCALEERKGGSGSPCWCDTIQGTRHPRGVFSVQVGGPVWAPGMLVTADIAAPPSAASHGGGLFGQWARPPF